MINSLEYCPNCIIKMVEKTRPTGRGKRIFLVCPTCGYNIQRSSIIPEAKKEIEEFVKRIEGVNYDLESTD